MQGRIFLQVIIFKAPFVDFRCMMFIPVLIKELPCILAHSAEGLTNQTYPYGTKCY